MNLTRRQADLLEFIRAYIADHGIPPSFDEMMDGIGLHSKSSVHRLILAIEERGKIRRIPNRARVIDLVPDRQQEELYIDYLEAEIGKLRGQVAQMQRKLYRFGLE